MPGKPLTLTPVRVRGRRNTATILKRRRLSQSRKVPISSSPSARSVSGTPHKKRRIRLTRLEDLPTEVLEIIFLYSGNVNLPLVSAGLATQLSGHQLQVRMMNAILGPIFSDHVTSLSELQLSMFESILARRFCHWSFFHKWMKTHSVEDSRAYYFQVKRLYPSATAWPKTLYYDEYRREEGRLPRPLRLPTKLLRGPWTDDKIQFLECFIYANGSNFWSDEKECARMSSYNGIEDAIRERSCRAVDLLFVLGVDPEPDFMHVAIMDEGCDRDVVAQLFSWTKLVMHTEHSRRRLRWPVVDSLDPVLWSWAEQPTQKHDGKGALVCSFLRSMN